MPKLSLDWLYPLLLQTVEEPDRIKDLHRPLRHLVGTDAVELEDAVTQGHEFGKTVNEVREEPGDVVHHLVEGKVSHRHVAEVPVILPAGMFKFCQFWHDLLLPVELRRLLRSASVGVAVHLADEGDDVVLEVVLALEDVETHAVAHAVAQHRQPIRLPHQIFDDPVLTSYHEVAVLQERQPLDYPLLGLVALEAIPLLWREEAVPIRQLQVFTKQPADLCLSPHSEVANHHAVLFHFLLLLLLLVVFAVHHNQRDLKYF